MSSRGRGLPAPGSKKLKTESKKSQKEEISTLFSTFFWLFFDSGFNFWDPRAGRPWELIFQLRSNFGPEGPKNSSGGMDGPQATPTNANGATQTAMQRTQVYEDDPGSVSMFLAGHCERVLHFMGREVKGW